MLYCHDLFISHVCLQGEVVSNHDELMCNFFAQADALAKGKTAIELRSENVPDHLIPHKTFSGNRPSLSILLPALDAYTTGQILSMYEHRVAVQVSRKLLYWGSCLGTLPAKGGREPAHHGAAGKRRHASHRHVALSAAGSRLHNRGDPSVTAQGGSAGKHSTYNGSLWKSCCISSAARCVL